MRNVLNKLENDKKIFNLKIKFVRLNIRQSLSYLHERIKSYATIIRKEDNNQDSFERYLRIRKLEARRAKFFSLKIKIIFAYSEACTDVRLYLKAKNHPEKYPHPSSAYYMGSEVFPQVPDLLTVPSDPAP